ncbi:hypothetical protein [uncultured Brachyspira sp.]|uniref:hypothetical protein n=1 Tax=uncultured Brachyspira sp. TaxID=221953 RepID=UPI0026259E5E|nr:hypothetical protein [uncultured Brachyspira sp.]
MLSTNNKLIANISKEFNIENYEANSIIERLFSKIADAVFKKNRFYMDQLGIISVNSSNDIIFVNENENFDESLESINLKNDNIKSIFLEKSIYKSIFKNIKEISKNENVYIENFGVFSNNINIKFEADNILKNKIKKLNVNEIVEDISDDIDKKISYNKSEIINNKAEENNDDSLEEIVENKSIDLNNIIKKLNEKENDKNKLKTDNTYNDNSLEEISENKSIDNNVNIIENIWKNKTYKSIDLNNMIKNLNEKENGKNKLKTDNISSENNNYSEMKEYSKKELLDINNFDNDDLKYQKKSKDNNKNLNIKKTKRRKNNMEKKENTKRELFLNIIKIACIIIFILIVGIIVSLYYSRNENIVSNNIENQKLYDIVNVYFNEIDSVSLSYITSKDMYYWAIAKNLYGDSTYWPLIYAYNSEEYKINDIIKKGSSISYRNIPDFNSMKEIKYLNNIISKSYICIYPILMNDNKINHALWSLKLSAYYDLNVLKNNADMIPEEIYLDILENNNSMKTAYNEVIKYGKLNENIFLSFLELIKNKLGI